MIKNSDKLLPVLSVNHIFDLFHRGKYNMFMN